METKIEKEIEFGEMFGEYILSPPDVDMKEHWDVAIGWRRFIRSVTSMAGERVGVLGNEVGPIGTDLTVQDEAAYRVDVKAQPLGKQSHSYRWVELQNVRGDKGWVYGEADFIAFEYDRYWILVPRRRLTKLIEERLDNSRLEGRDWVNNPQPFKIHTREGRNDRVMMVPVVDLCWIGTIIEKPKPKKNG